MTKGTNNVDEVKEVASSVLNAPKSATFVNFAEEIGDVVERRLKFKPRPELNNLTQGFLINAELKMIEAPLTNAKTGLPSTWEYAGYSLPNLRLTFLQNPTKEDPAERYLEVVFSPYATVKSDNTAIEASQIASHYQYEYLKLRHIANAFKLNANYFNVTIPGFDYLAPTKERLEGLTAYYKAWETMFKGKDGKGFASQLNNIKVVADSLKGQYLTLPDFVGEGFIEKTVEGRMPTIELKPSDTVVLVAADKKSRTKGGSASSTANGAPAPEAEVSSEMADILKKYQQG